MDGVMLPMVIEKRKSLSGVLRELCADPKEEMTISEVVEAFGRRAFGAMLFVFAVPNLLPLPPGSSSILGLPLLLLAPQVAIGVRWPWLPGFVRKRHVNGSELKMAFGKLLPGIEKIERVSRARYAFMFGAVGDRIIGVICALLAFVLILPIPFGNMLPAITIGAFGLALFQRDGVVAAIGYALAAVSFGVLVLGFAAAVAAFNTLLRMIGLGA